MEFTIISIGALAANPLWAERSPVRTGHSTTTLVRTKCLESPGLATILVDPGLPEPALIARLRERAGIGPEEVTHVFLTTFHPETRRAITAFSDAIWLISPRERETAGVPLAQSLGRLAETQQAAEAAGEHLDEEQSRMFEVLRQDVAVLQRCRPVPDKLAEGVDVFPLPGVTPGCTGLLLSGRETTLICGDAVATAGHVDQGKVLPNCADREQAKESFQEAIEIADLLVPGRDNLMVNPTRKPF